MNKLVIPSTLGVIVAIAAIFALAPIDEATTVHKTVIQEITQDVSGASLVFEATQLSTSFDGADDIFHFVWIESDELFTVKEIEIEADIGGATDNADNIRLKNVWIIPEEYAKTLDGAQDASDDRSDSNSASKICDSCDHRIISGDDTVDVATGSFNAYQYAFTGDPTGVSVGPGSMLMVEIQMTENNDDPLTMTADIIFYLSGPDSVLDINQTQLTQQTESSDGV